MHINNHTLFCSVSSEENAKFEVFLSSLYLGVMYRDTELKIEGRLVHLSLFAHIYNGKGKDTKTLD